MYTHASALSFAYQEFMLDNGYNDSKKQTTENLKIGD